MSLSVQNGSRSMNDTAAARSGAETMMQPARTSVFTKGPEAITAPSAMAR